MVVDLFVTCNMIFAHVYSGVDLLTSRISDLAYSYFIALKCVFPCVMLTWLLVCVAPPLEHRMVQCCMPALALRQFESLEKW